MKKSLSLPLWLCLSFMILDASAQVGIGTPLPNSSAQLDVVANNKGLLIPRVALQAPNVTNPISNPATSLLVYNTSATADLVPGFYYWNGTMWIPIGEDDTDTNTTNVSLSQDGTNLMLTDSDGNTVSVALTDIDTNTTNVSLSQDGTNLMLTDSDGNTVSVALTDIDTNTTNVSLSQDGTNLMLTDSDGNTVSVALT
ncbi:hypothetical protein V8G61_14860, partial [Gaetbulibacter sp. M240]